MPKKAAREKKLWRKAIDTQELQDTLEEKSRQERQGLATDQLVDTQLFFIDKERDEATASAVEKGALRHRRKREVKPLRCQTILESAHKARPVNAAMTQPRKRKGPALKGKSALVELVNRVAPAQEEAADVLDIWDDQDTSATQRKFAKRRRLEEGIPIKAVEVDAPGCSYNPDPEQHEDVIAEAVAIEMAKAYRQDSQPRIIPQLTNPAEGLDELEMLLVDAEPDEEGDQGGAEEPSGDEQGIAGAVRHASQKKTQKERNKDKRRRNAEEALQAKLRLKQQRRELQSLKDLQADIATQDAVNAAKAARKAANRAEKLASQPPRLSKHKFQPATLQVLLSEEIDGSLRRLKGTPVLAKDRFKSLQKRGIIEPRVRVQPRQARKRPTYQIGDRAEKNKAGHEEIRGAQKTIARRKAAASKAQAK